jgi:hypothetical protein
MNAFKKTLLGLGAVAALTMGVAAMSTGAMADPQNDCFSCIDQQQQLQTFQPSTRGANLSFPALAGTHQMAVTSANGGANYCNDVLNQPSSFPYDAVRACDASAH